MLINPDDYAAFITHPETGEPMEIDRFCNIVQAMGKEAGMYLSRCSQNLLLNLQKITLRWTRCAKSYDSTSTLPILTAAAIQWISSSLTTTAIQTQPLSISFIGE